MQNIVTAIFNVKSEAYQAFSQMRHAPFGQDYVVAEAALIKREGDAIKVEEAFENIATNPDHAGFGMAAGALLGILGGPLGVLLGAYTGGITGAAFDTADTADSLALLETTAAKLIDGDVAIIALVQEEEPAFDAAFKGFDVRIVRHFATDVMDEVDRAIDAAEEKENLDRLEERAKRKAENKKFWDELAEQYEINRREREAERTAEREAYLDGLAEEANAMNKKLAELDKAIGKRIKEKEAEDEAFDQAMEDAKAAYVSQTKEIYGK